LVERLGFGADVRDALRFTFERYNGQGFPAGARGEAIPLAMRVVHVTHDAEAIARRFSPERAMVAVRERAGRTYDPALAECFSAHAEAWFERLAALDPWDAVLALEPAPQRELDGAEFDAALTVVADFVDLKSPFWAGHSRRCAVLAGRAAAELGLDVDARKALERAAWLHDLGTTAIPNSIWDKPGPLTRAERDRVGLHAELGGQMLRRSPALAVLAPLVRAHHENVAVSGHARRTEPASVAASLLVAADVFVALTAERADRPAFDAAAAAAEARRMAARGELDARALEAVLSAAGLPAALARTSLPGGLSAREAEVLSLAARGLTTKVIAERLGITPKTCDHHIQHIYDKLGVSTRAAAALWAVQHGLLDRS